MLMENFLEDVTSPSTCIRLDMQSIALHVFVDRRFQSGELAEMIEKVMAE